MGIFPCELHPRHQNPASLGFQQLSSRSLDENFPTELVAMENLMQRFPEKKPLDF